MVDEFTSDYWEGWAEHPGASFSLASPFFIFLVFYILTCVFAVFGYTLYRLCSRPCCSRKRLSRPSFNRRKSFKDMRPSVSGLHEYAFPAYGDDQPVEYFSRTHAKWLAADCVANLKEKKGDVLHDEQEDVTYTATLRNSVQEREDIPVDMLRCPLGPEEVCDIWSSTTGKWLPGRTGGHRKIVGQFIMYQVQHEKKKRSRLSLANKKPQEATFFDVPGSALRRRFVPGQDVRVFLGLLEGWDHAKVTSGAQYPLTVAGKDSHAKHYWKMVPVEVERGGEKFVDRVPSYLLRPVGFPSPQPLYRRAKLDDDEESGSGSGGSGGNNPNPFAHAEAPRRQKSTLASRRKERQPTMFVPNPQGQAAAAAGLRAAAADEEDSDDTDEAQKGGLQMPAAGLGSSLHAYKRKSEHAPPNIGGNATATMVTGRGPLPQLFAEEAGHNADEQWSKTYAV